MVRRMFRMKCPACGYEYYVELMTPPVIESCPAACYTEHAYHGKFEEFILYEVEPQKE